MSSSCAGDVGGAPAWDMILRTTGWDVVHAYGTALEGWLVLATRRHITAVADMDDTEVGELGPLLQRVSRALQEALGCTKTYVAQFAEDPRHPHVHFHVIPRQADQPAEWKGPRIFSQLGVAEELCIPEPRMDEIAYAVATRLSAAG